MEEIINGLKQIKTRVDSGTITTVNGTETLLSKQLAKMIESAINYTHSCKSDSELLKDKPKLNFEDWYITYGYAKSFTGNFVKEGIRYTADQMQFKYEYNMP